MASALSITAAVPDSALLDLPWDLPLDLWPDETIASLPKGISRHLVRFAHLGGYVVAIKETSAELAKREYEMLRTLQRLDIPCVDPVAVITNRATVDGDELQPVLVTRHLKFSLPYRALYSQTLRPDTATRLVDALAVLLARLHIIGFFWGDVSLSNTLFRRDAGAFAAYLVDAETGKLYDGGLSNGQRENDLEIARVNIAGELLDLQAGGRLDEELDPVAIADGIVAQYRSLWAELTGSESFPEAERWRINERVQRLNDLGFDIEELSIRKDDTGTQVRIQPKVVDAGHHSRRLLRLTGLDAGENQARRLLNDLDSYRATGDRANLDEEQVAHEWLAKVFEPVIRAVPRDLRGKLEPAELFHQLLDHRWYLSQNTGHSVPLAEALTSYIETILRHRRDEMTVVAPVTGLIDVPVETSAMPIISPDDDEEDWRAKV
ncbi:MAG: lipopolysaccharide kinase [Leifsonia sp.]|nr:lipopolysaccharide kinase [Leifsonia sp.]|tara:strand:- start:46690 stop:47997 length:1308 start_codon:yes stop_codon:yes gene_type:complete